MNEATNLGAAATAPAGELQTSSKRAAIDNLYFAVTQALGNAAQNAVYAQQQFAVSVQAATTVGIETIYSEGSPEAAANNATQPDKTFVESSQQESVSAEPANLIPAGFSASSISSNNENISLEIEALMSSFSNAMDQIAQTQLRYSNAMVKQALEVKFLLKLIESPEEYSAYAEDIFSKIKNF